MMRKTAALFLTSALIMVSCGPSVDVKRRHTRQAEIASVKDSSRPERTAGTGRAEDRAVAQNVIAQAIHAGGSEDRLARTRTMIRNATGKLFVFDKEYHFSTQLTLDLPDRFRDLIEFEADNQKNHITRVVTRDQAWMLNAGVKSEISKPEADELREEAYVIWLTTLIPLKDSAFQLSPVPDATVDGRPAAGVHVSRAGHGDVSLYFDKQTSRLVKIERQALEVGLPVKKEYLLSEPREFEGIMRATKQIEFTAGKKSTELSITSFQFPGKVDDSVFAKP
jgi:hypothetical protein